MKYSAGDEVYYHGELVSGLCTIVSVDDLNMFYIVYINTQHWRANENELRPLTKLDKALQ